MTCSIHTLYYVHEIETEFDPGCVPCRLAASERSTRMNPADSLLSKAAVMERLGVSEKTLRRLIRQGRLRVVKLGKTSPLKFRQLDVAHLLERSVVTGAAAFFPTKA